MLYQKGDVVSLDVRKAYPGRPTSVLGSIEGTVVAVSSTSADESFEVNIVPTDWDAACDLLAREDSMSWTEIRDMRELGSIDNVPVDEDLVLVARPKTDEQLDTDIQGAIDGMSSTLSQLWALRSGDVDPITAAFFDDEVVPAIKKFYRSLYYGNQVAG